MKNFSLASVREFFNFSENKGKKVDDDFSLSGLTPETASSLRTII